MGYFDAEDQTSFSPIYPHANWNLWIYKADAGIVVYNGTESGMKSIDTSGWASGTYVVRGTADGQSFAKVYAISGN